MHERHFPPAWSVEQPDPKLDRQCFIVRDSNAEALAYVYFDDEPGRRTAAELLTYDEARRIAANIAKLSGLVRNRKGSSLLPEQFIVWIFAPVAVRNIFSTRINLTVPLDRRQQVTRRPRRCGIPHGRARL